MEKFRTTQEILDRLCGRDHPDCFEPLTDIPEFDPVKHSDGCSGGMSVAYAKLPLWVHQRYGETLPWHHCCVEHDRAYYYGGTRERKLAADEALKRCVAETLQDNQAGMLLALAMQMAVTIGGQPYFATAYRWGYGADFRGTEDLPAGTPEQSRHTHTPSA
jgi:hypothetical protein